MNTLNPVDLKLNDIPSGRVSPLFAPEREEDFPQVPLAFFQAMVATKLFPWDHYGEMKRQMQPYRTEIRIGILAYPCPSHASAFFRFGDASMIYRMIDYGDI